MNEETQISGLIARKITGVASADEWNEWKIITENDLEMEQAIKVIINLWNAQGPRNKKEVEMALRKVSERLNKRRAFTATKHPEGKGRLLRLRAFFT